VSSAHTAAHTLTDGFFALWSDQDTRSRFRARRRVQSSRCRWCV